jgi:hypothetical protein
MPIIYNLQLVLIEDFSENASMFASFAYWLSGMVFLNLVKISCECECHVFIALRCASIAQYGGDVSI